MGHSGWCPVERSDLNAQMDLLKQGRTARAEQRFGAAYDAFMGADRLGELSTEDVLAWSDAAWWLGRTDQALQLAERGHRELVDQGETIRAAKEAIGLGFLLMIRGDMAAGSGWLQRGRSMLERSPGTGSRGYVAQLDAQYALDNGEVGRAVDLAREAEDAARSVADSALLSLALMTKGTALLRAGAVTESMAVLDEAMLPVRSGQVPPEMAGNLYCQMIAICWELADLRRAREWTGATERWCAGFDSSVMFSGICRMHRVQLRQVSGEWDLAADEARVVCTELAGMNTAVVAEGHYLMGDLLRLRSRARDAEAAYLHARELGRDPQPGLALLMAQSGHAASAVRSLHASLAGHRGGEYGRAPLLRALVEVAIDAEDVETARNAADQLSAVARRWRSDGLQAAAAHAQGMVGLASAEPASAVALLREAVSRWRELDAPYECARARVVLSEALSALGDNSAAQLEAEIAAKTLGDLDAIIDLERLAPTRPAGNRPEGLTAREAEILMLVADGITNRQVADALVISEKTVARHLANVYLKVGVSTRTAAVAWARRKGLHPPE
jgi:DNA-binding CsgD family transcriptional regulator